MVQEVHRRFRIQRIKLMVMFIT